VSAEQAMRASRRLYVSTEHVSQLARSRERLNVDQQSVTHVDCPVRYQRAGTTAEMWLDLWLYLWRTAFVPQVRAPGLSCWEDVQDTTATPGKVRSILVNGCKARIFV
jgi:hypothetical protein